MTPATTSTGPSDPKPGRQTMYHPRPCRLRNPDQLRRHERYHLAVGEFKNVSLTMTHYPAEIGTHRLSARLARLNRLAWA